MFVCKRLENLVSESKANYIESRLLDLDWWTFNDVTSNVGINYDTTDTNIKESYQFTATFADQEQGIKSPLYLEIAQPLLWMLEKDTGIEIEHVIRVKANLLTKSDHKEHNYHIPHIDHGNDDSLSMVYYVNDSDGDTKMFDKYVQQGHTNLSVKLSNTPAKGSALLFQSHRFHSSSSPVQSSKRCVINFVFKPTYNSYKKFLENSPQ